jgi:hypothetical protein
MLSSRVDAINRVDVLSQWRAYGEMVGVYRSGFDSLEHRGRILKSELRTPVTEIVGTERLLPRRSRAAPS